MKIEKITLTNIKAEPNMWLYNGKIFANEVLLGINDSVDNWKEITEEEKEEIEAKQGEDFEDNIN